MQSRLAFTFLLVVFTLVQLNADMRVEPSWRKVIEESEVIALIEYTSNGSFWAKAKPLKDFYEIVRAGKITDTKILH